MIEPYKSKAKTSIKKAIGQLNKTLQMIEEDKYCIDIVQQVLAAQGLIKSTQSSLLENHFNTCFKHALTTKNKKREDEMITELMKIFGISNK
jgi:DNA-binding FrmR family transcriptional regulator